MADVSLKERPYGFVNSKRSEAGSMLLELGWECGEERSDGWNIEVDDPRVPEEATHHVGLEVGSPVAIRVDDGESMRATAERLTTYSGAGAVSTLLAAPADLTDRLRKGARVEIEGTVTYQEWDGYGTDRKIRVLERAPARWKHDLGGAARALAIAEAHCAREGVGPRTVRPKVCAEVREDLASMSKLMLTGMDNWRGKAREALGKEDYESFEEAAAKQCLVATMAAQMLLTKKEEASQCRSIEETDAYAEAAGRLAPVITWCARFELLPGTRLGEGVGE